MSPVQEGITAIYREDYIPWHEELINVNSVVKVPVRGKLLDANVKCLLGLGFVPIIVARVTGIWPIALAGLGPWLLTWLDINQRKRNRNR